jgi:hypothetical protein
MKIASLLSFLSVIFVVFNLGKYMNFWWFWVWSPIWGGFLCSVFFLCLGMLLLVVPNLRKK